MKFCNGPQQFLELLDHFHRQHGSRQEMCTLTKVESTSLHDLHTISKLSSCGSICHRISPHGIYLPPTTSLQALLSDCSLLLTENNRCRVNFSLGWKNSLSSKVRAIVVWHSAICQEPPNPPPPPPPPVTWVLLPVNDVIHLLHTHACV